MMNIRILGLGFFVFSSLLLFPHVSLAQYVPGAPVIVNAGFTTTLQLLFNGLVNLTLTWSPLIATALFVAGAITMAISGGEDTAVSNGKKIMKGAVIGLAIVYGSWLILNTVVFILRG